MTRQRTQLSNIFFLIVVAIFLLHTIIANNTEIEGEFDFNNLTFIDTHNVLNESSPSELPASNEQINQIFNSMKEIASHNGETREIITDEPATKSPIIEEYSANELNIETEIPVTGFDSPVAIDDLQQKLQSDILCVDENLSSIECNDSSFNISQVQNEGGEANLTANHLIDDSINITVSLTNADNKTISTPNVTQSLDTSNIDASLPVPSSEPKEKKNPIIELKDQVLKQIEEKKKEKKSNTANIQQQNGENNNDNNNVINSNNNNNNNVNEPIIPVTTSSSSSATISTTESAPTSTGSHQSLSSSNSNPSIIYPSPSPSSSRNDRFNYAAYDSGAKLLLSSPGMKKASSMLVNDDDRYMMVPCANNDKEFIIQLKEDILIHSVEISNFEHYSSSIKEFQLFGSNIYPCENDCQWNLLGLFQAPDSHHPVLFHLPHSNNNHQSNINNNNNNNNNQNSNNNLHIDVNSDNDFAVRYIKLKWLSQWKNEYYCTITSIKVYGVTVLEAFRDDLDQSAQVVREVEQVVRGINNNVIKKDNEEKLILDEENKLELNNKKEENEVKTGQNSETNKNSNNINVEIDPARTTNSQTFWDIFGSWSVVSSRSSPTTRSAATCDTDAEPTIPNINLAPTDSTVDTTPPNRDHEDNRNVEPAEIVTDISSENPQSLKPAIIPSNPSVILIPPTNPNTESPPSSSLTDFTPSQSPFLSAASSASTFIYSQLARLGQQAGAQSQAEAEAAANKIDPQYAALLARYTRRDNQNTGTESQPSTSDSVQPNSVTATVIGSEGEESKISTSESSNANEAAKSNNVNNNNAASSTSNTNTNTNNINNNPKSSVNSHQSIFKTLTNRLKELEVHQALSTHFISDLSDRFADDIETMKKSLKYLTNELNQKNSLKEAIIKENNFKLFEIKSELLTEINKEINEKLLLIEIVGVAVQV